MNLFLPSSQVTEIVKQLTRIADVLEGFVSPKEQEWSVPDKPFGPDSLQALSEETLWELEQEEERQRALGRLPDLDEEGEMGE